LKRKYQHQDNSNASLGGWHGYLVCLSLWGNLSTFVCIYGRVHLRLISICSPSKSEKAILHWQGVYLALTCTLISTTEKAIQYISHAFSRH
jgi:hypothetical protein